MKVDDANAALKQAAIDLSGLPLEMATALHASAVGAHSNQVSERTWAELHALRPPITEIGIDEPVAALQKAIEDIRAAFPQVAAQSSMAPEQ